MHAFGQNGLIPLPVDNFRNKEIVCILVITFQFHILHLL